MSLNRPITVAPSRQTVITGRAVERLSDRPLAVQEAELLLDTGSGFARLPAALETAPFGYFALHMATARAWPDSFPAAQATLRLRTRLDTDLWVDTDIPFDTAGRARSTTAATVNGTAYNVAGLPGGAFEVTLSRDPAPLTLRGIVVRGNDLSAPENNARIRVMGQTVRTGPDGRFSLSPLPLVADLTVEARRGQRTTSTVIRLDYTRPINTVMLSLSDT